MRSDEAASWSITMFVLVFAVILLIGVTIWYFAARDTQPTVTQIEIEDRRPDTYVIPTPTPAPETRVVPVPTPAPEPRREIIQQPDVTIEVPSAPEPDNEQEPEVD